MRTPERQLLDQLFSTWAPALRLAHKPRHCKHGNNRALGPCPECQNEKMRARQRRANRARFAAQLAHIKGLR